MKRVFFWVLFLILLVSFGNEGWVTWYRLRQFEKLLEQKNLLFSRGNLLLRKEIELLKEPTYLERHIREELGYVRENEILYMLLDTPNDL